MEEILYILPFERYGQVIIVTIFIILIILFAVILRVLKIPQKLMAMVVAALAMLFFLYIQTEGFARLSPLIDVPKRQTQLNQQLKTNPLPLDGAELRHISVRFNSLTLDFFIKKSTYKTMQYDNLAAYAQNFARKNQKALCKLLQLEQESPYRQDSLLFNLKLRRLSLHFSSDNEQYNRDYTEEFFHCF